MKISATKKIKMTIDSLLISNSLVSKAFMIVDELHL